MGSTERTGDIAKRARLQFLWEADDGDKRTEIALRVGKPGRNKYSFTWYPKVHRWRYLGFMPKIKIDKTEYWGFSFGFCAITRIYRRVS